MPWTASDAEKHTHKASTEHLRELWAKVANESLSRGDPEAVAVRKANAVVAGLAVARHWKGLAVNLRAEGLTRDASQAEQTSAWWMAYAIALSQIGSG